MPKLKNYFLKSFAIFNVLLFVLEIPLFPGILFLLIMSMDSCGGSQAYELSCNFGLRIVTLFLFLALIHSVIYLFTVFPFVLLKFNSDKDRHTKNQNRHIDNSTIIN